MTQPDYVPLQSPDRVRPSDSLSTPERWTQDRPADLAELRQPEGARFGATGPDLGYGLKLAKRFEDRLALQPGEDAHDAVAAAFASGAKRAAGFGRAPVIYDFEWAYSLWGYLGEPTADLVAWRVPLIRGSSHGYWHQRGVVDTVAAGTFRLTPAQVREQAAGPDWAQLFTRP
ncbi:hypothetical protein K6U06_08055 [Acidiferrimicrobium sp. IK]|uniref:hypothetical protein n=1 Tax=Acidiferrimicrobium sp. IK TaxID=2871700 RepID=UPI0021CB2562|nr:hypothetical protein [Acidiferrimicrobium sp. IK]MCU4184312.1 hypothetical protein [Acidiferrimicrobium sp. IK]